ncbi:CLUMA_CG008473, isoform A, partial [Clunio marinus]
METQNITFLSFILADNSSFNETFHEDNFSISYNEPNKRDSLYLLIPITLIYVIIFISGCIGNISTCIVIAKNKSMYSATNYYLFSLAVSDFILLVSGAPMELYFYWFKGQFIFGDVFCIVRNMINEMAANATVLTITAFTIERYVAICHPFLSHTISKLSRAVKYIFLIWILSISFATLLALQTGVQVYPETGETHCMMIEERAIIPHTFYISTVLFFFAPMSLITVLYILIGVKLRSSTMITRENGSTIQRNNNLISNNNQNTSQSTKRVLKMLVAVVICFFVSWFPFHAQRLVYNWAMQNENPAEHEFLAKIYFFVTYSSGILYYLSTCINPLLYNIMSNKFRQAFKETLQKKCCTCSSPQTHHQKRQYRILSRGKRRYGQPESTEYSGSGKDDYSSSTQKQSVDTITTSRNTSLKHYKINKSFDTFAKSPSLFAMGPSNARFSESIESTNCHTYLTTKITNSEINISSECNINEIHLNIFPPSATYIKEPPNIFGCQSDEKSLDRSQNYVNIDIIVLFWKISHLAR